MNEAPVESSSQEHVLREWTRALVTGLRVDGLEVDIDRVLALAGEAAHAVLRPAAPLTTFVAGYAAGIAAASGTSSPQDASSAAMATAADLCRAAANAPDL